jgi:uncharacterized metal-binding protein
MPELLQKKVGIVACSGEELAEGTVTRLAALKVLEQLRPADTVTICLPLFLAGGEGDRAFAKFYPTIAIDGCEKRCAFRGTEMYSNEPARSLVIRELAAEKGLGEIEGKRKLNPAGRQAVEEAAQRIAAQVDELLGRGWDRTRGEFATVAVEPQEEETVQATCSCGSGIPVQDVPVDGKVLTLIALPLIFQSFQEARKAPGDPALAEMMDMLKVYNPVQPADEAAVAAAILQEYSRYWRDHEVSHG